MNYYFVYHHTFYIISINNFKKVKIYITMMNSNNIIKKVNIKYKNVLVSSDMLDKGSMKGSSKKSNN